MGPLLPGEPHWLIGRSGGRPRIGLHAILLRVPPDEPRYDIAAILRGELPSPDPQPAPSPGVAAEALYPALVVMLPGYTCVPAGPDANDPTLLGGTLHALHAWAQRRGVRSISFLYVPERQRTLRHVLEEFGARPARLYPTCVMPIDFGTMDDYLLRLPKARRRDLQRLRRRTSESGLIVGEDDLADVYDDVLDLRLTTLRKYDSADDRDTQAAALKRMIDHYPAQDRVLVTARRGDRVAGFNLAFAHGDTLRDMWCGQRPDIYGAYFVLTFDEIVRAALRRRIATIDYGTLRWSLKASFGCRLEPLTGHTWTV